MYFPSPSRTQRDDSESTLTRQQTFEGHKLGVLSVDIDREGTKAISSSIDGQIKVWDVVRGKYVRNLDTSGSAYML